MKNFVIIVSFLSSIFLRAQDIKYDSYKNVSIINYKCSGNIIEIKEEGKILDFYSLSEDHFMYWLFVGEEEETDLGQTFIKIKDCNNCVTSNVEILNNDAVISFNENILLIANNEKAEITTESIINIYEISSGKDLKTIEIKKKSGQKLTKIVSTENKSFIQMNESDGKTFAIKIIDNYDYSIKTKQISPKKYLVLRKDTSNKYAFLLDLNNKLVQYLTTKSDKPIKYLDDQGEEMLLD